MATSRQVAKADGPAGGRRRRRLSTIFARAVTVPVVANETDPDGDELGYSLAGPTTRTGARHFRR